MKANPARRSPKYCGRTSGQLQVKEREKRKAHLDHVIALGLSVHKDVKSDLLLELDDRLDLVLDEGLVLGGGELTLAELGTSDTDLLGLREGSDGGGGCGRGRG